MDQKPEPQISITFSEERTVVHNYRFFYYLANELTHLAIQDKDGINAFRYTMGVVIFSYTTIEVFTNHIFHSNHYKIHELFSSLSDELSEKMERFSLNEKIEFALRFYPAAKVKELKKGEEPFQSFDILRQLRNSLIHYMPKEELVRSDNEEYLEQLTKLEKKARSKFEVEDLASSQMAFVYRCFNKDCALWAFNLVQPFIDWLCDNLNIERHELNKYWDLQKEAAQFVVCINSEGYKASLEVGKLYRFIPDQEAEAEGLLRVIDETGEDYAFQAARFYRVRLPAPVEKALLVASHS